MKILVICQYYHPEPFRISDICEEWVKQGHVVQVVTGKPNYPMGEIYEGYKGHEKCDEVINGVKVHRCFEIPRKKGIVFRFFNYYSFSWSATRYVKKMKDRYDVVFVNQLSPVMMAKPGVAYKKKFGVNLVLYSLDLWPESLIAGGLKRGSLLYRYYHRVSEKIYKSVDKIAVTSKLFKNYFVEQFKISEQKISYLPQYAESLFSKETCRQNTAETIDLLFAGNIGSAQNVETIIHAAAQTQDVKNLRWHIVGDGSNLEKCKLLANQLNVNTITFYGREPLDRMPYYYQKADAMLVTLMKDEFLSWTLPGKVQTYMAAGKPILAAADGEIKDVIETADCGFCVEAEDFNALAKVVRQFCALSLEDKMKLSDNAEKFYKKNFEKSVFFEEVDKLLK